MKKMVLSEQVYALLHDGEVYTDDEKNEGRRADTDNKDSADTRRSCRLWRQRWRRRRRRRYVKRYSLAELAWRHNIPGLAAMPCRPESTLLCKTGYLYYGDACQPRRGRAKLRVVCTGDDDDDDQARERCTGQCLQFLCFAFLLTQGTSSKGGA